MKTRSQTLVDFYNKIDEEIYVLKNGLETQNAKLIEEIENLWKSKNLDLLIDQVETLKQKYLSSFVIEEDEANDNFDLEVALIRIHVLALLVQDLLTYLETDKSDLVYQTLVQNYGYYEFDFLTLTSLFKVGQQYIASFYEFMNVQPVFDEAAKFFHHIQVPVENLIKESDFFNFFEQLADLFDSLMNFLESLGEIEFDWDLEEQQKADEIIYVISLLQWSIYFLLLLKQDATREMELRNSLKFQKNTEIIDEREDFLNDLEIWKNLK